MFDFHSGAGFSIFQSDVAEDHNIHLLSFYDENSWISETAIIVGYVTIADDVFVAKNAVIMADYERCSLL